MKTKNFQLKDSFSEFKNYYAVLGIRNYVPIEKVKKVYRQLAQLLYPDEDSLDSSINNFVKINEAYHTLGNPKKKIDYDRFLMIKDRNIPLLVIYTDVNKAGYWRPGLEHAIKLGITLMRYTPTQQELMKMHSL